MAGMFTVMVAAMHRKVFAVDPLLANLAFIDYSLKKSNNSQFVSLINNPIRLKNKKKSNNIKII